MSILGRIYDLMAKVEPDRAPALTAVFDDGHREVVPRESTPCIWAMKRAMAAGGPRIVRFESEEDPSFAEDATHFFHCLSPTGDLSHLWDNYGQEE